MAKLMAKQTVSNLTEAEAIVRAREGDAAGFEHLYRAHCRHVYGVCLRMIKNSADAEDLTQQNPARATRKLPFGYKQIFLLHDVMGYEHGEGNLVAMLCRQFKSQLHKARKRLQLLLYGGEGQAEHNLASPACRDAAVTGIGPKRHPDVTYRLSGTAILQLGQRSG